MKLAVRLWEGDPRLQDYSAKRWPKGWYFYRSQEKYLGPSLNEFFRNYPDEPSYGFIADDVVLRTPEGLEHLEALAEPHFVAYPNDCLQRHKLCTHFCVGGELARELGWFVLPQMLHSVDMPWWNIGRNTGVLRYAPGVIFQHKHFLADSAIEKDATYEIMYRGSAMAPNSALYDQDKKVLERYLSEKGTFAKDVIKTMRCVYAASEDWDEWNAQDRADAIVLPEVLNG